ncbi:hypothetical protein D5086_027715 [Populus alba]|uniref:Uncharacterized protein n=1 Tax=Populus alba TaxID=43335 RepID=A0ACC4AWN9_POPAL
MNCSDIGVSDLHSPMKLGNPHKDHVTTQLDSHLYPLQSSDISIFAGEVVERIRVRMGASSENMVAKVKKKVKKASEMPK